MALDQRELPLLIAPVDIAQDIDLTKVSEKARRLHHLMTATTSQNLAQEITDLGGNSVRTVVSGVSRLCIGRSKDKLHDALLTHQVPGGKATAKHAPKIELGSRKQVSLINAPVIWASDSVDPALWYDSTAWKELGLKYSAKAALSAWKCHLVRLWAAAFPAAAFMEAVTRNTGATTTTADVTSQADDDSDEDVGQSGTLKVEFASENEDEDAGDEPDVTFGRQSIDGSATDDVLANNAVIGGEAFNDQHGDHENFDDSDNEDDASESPTVAELKALSDYCDMLDQQNLALETEYKNLCSDYRMVDEHIAPGVEKHDSAVRKTVKKFGGSAELGAKMVKVCLANMQS